MPGPIETPGPRVLRASRQPTVAPPGTRDGAAVGFGPGSVDQPTNATLPVGSILAVGGGTLQPGTASAFVALPAYSGPAQIHVAIDVAVGLVNGFVLAEVISLFNIGAPLGGGNQLYSDVVQAVGHFSFNDEFQVVAANTGVLIANTTNVVVTYVFTVQVSSG